MTCVFLSRCLWRKIRDLSDDISLDIRCDTRRQMRIKKARSPERIAPFFLSDYIYSMLFIFIYNPRSDSGTLRKRIGWDPELTIGLGNTLAVLMKGNEFAGAKFYGESTSLSFIYRIISHSFFPLRFLNFCPRLCYLCPSRAPQFHLSSIHQIFVSQIPTATWIF